MCNSHSRIHLGHQLSRGSKLQATRCTGWHLGPGRLHSAPPATPRPEPPASGPCTSQTSQRLSASTQGPGSTRRSLSWAPRSSEGRALTPRGRRRSLPPRALSPTHGPTESEGERQPTRKMSPGRAPPTAVLGADTPVRPEGGLQRRPRPVRASPATGGPRRPATPQAQPLPGPPGSEQAAPPPQPHPPSPPLTPAEP